MKAVILINTTVHISMTFLEVPAMCQSTSPGEPEGTLVFQIDFPPAPTSKSLYRCLPNILIFNSFRPHSCKVGIEILQYKKCLSFGLQ